MFQAGREKQLSLNHEERQVEEKQPLECSLRNTTDLTEDAQVSVLGQNYLSEIKGVGAASIGSTLVWQNDSADPLQPAGLQKQADNREITIA